MAFSLPDFPWDSLEPFKKQAAGHPQGLIDLSVGSPVDDTPVIAQEAMALAGNAPSYPLTAGTPELRSAIAAWWQRSTFLVNLISYFLRFYLQVSLKLVSRDFILLLYLPTYQLIFCIRREWSILIILLEGFRYHVSIVSSSFHEEWSFGSFIDA
jgi:hypothetical protein